MKKFLALALAVLLVLTSVTALAQTYTDKETVKAVQEALNAAGYPCGVADGIAPESTPRTRLSPIRRPTACPRPAPSMTRCSSPWA